MPTITHVELVLSCTDLSRVSFPWPALGGTGLQGTPFFAPDPFSKHADLPIGNERFTSRLCTCSLESENVIACSWSSVGPLGACAAPIGQTML